MRERNFISTKNIHVNLGISAFTFTKGGEVILKQIDDERNKVLLCFGGRDTGWFHQSFLDNNFVELIK